MPDILPMIRSFTSRQLKRLWERGDRSRLPPDRVAKIEMILDALDAAINPEDMDLPGLRFHQLKGDRKGQYSLTVTGNWRIVFGWEEGDAVHVEWVDYHEG